MVYEIETTTGDLPTNTLDHNKLIWVHVAGKSLRSVACIGSFTETDNRPVPLYFDLYLA